MTTDADFLRAITLAGDDLVPRLVYADYLEERGDAVRAGFLRDQVLVATTPTDTPARRAAAARAFALEAKHGKRWSVPLARRAHAHDCQFRGGFPDLIGIRATTLARHAKTMFANGPVRSLLVSGPAGHLDALEVIPRENGVTRLSLWGARLTAADLPRLAALGRNFPRLRTLSLLFNLLDDGAIPLLTGEPFFAGLERLELGANPFTEAGRDRLRAGLGGRVSFDCEREDDWLYRMPTGGPFSAGFDAAGVPVAVVEYERKPRRPRRFRAYHFDHAGLLIGEQTTKTNPAVEPAPVRVRRFHASDTGLVDFLGYWATILDDPTHHPHFRERHERFVSRHLAGGHFVLSSDQVEQNIGVNRAGQIIPLELEEDDVFNGPG